MNGVALDTGSIGNGRARSAFARGLSEVFDGAVRLERFHRAHVAGIVSSIEAFGPTVPAAQHIEYATRSQPSEEAVFDALLHGIGMESGGVPESP